MPRTTKDEAKLTAKKENVKTKSDANTKKTSTTTAKKSTTSKKTSSTTAKKSTTSKKTSSTTAKKGNTSKKTSSSVSIKKATQVKDSSSKKPRTTRNKSQKMLDFSEYYDLPYRYNETTIKVLAQTPQMLFVYWDISDTDRLLLMNQYGDEFFTKTRPVLIIHNETMNYSFEIEINDFANSWYIHVQDSNCKYSIELGRYPNLYQNDINKEYIFITSSNPMNAPNDHILFEKFDSNVAYRNIKTGNTIMKDFSHITNLNHMQEIYQIYDFYKQIYQNELFDEIVDGNLSNPSSLSSSQFK